MCQQPGAGATQRNSKHYHAADATLDVMQVVAASGETNPGGASKVVLAETSQCLLQDCV